MYRRLFLPAALGILGGFGMSLHERAAIHAVLNAPRVFGRPPIPRAPGSSGSKHAPQKPPRKNCKHRKPARARRRVARLRGRKG